MSKSPAKTIFITVPRSIGDFSAILLPILALLGGLGSAGLIFLLGTSRKKRLQPTRLIMTGVAMSSAYGAVGTFMMLLLDDSQLEFLQRWQAGELWGVRWDYIVVFAIWILLFGFMTYRGGRTLNVINVGYDIARGLGVNVGTQFIYLSLCAVALSSASVAFGGNFFFLGLIGPHIARRLVGTDARVLLPASGIVAGIIVLLADMLVQGLDVSRQYSHGNRDFCTVRTVFFVSAHESVRRKNGKQHCYTRFKYRL